MDKQEEKTIRNLPGKKSGIYVEEESRGGDTREPKQGGNREATKEEAIKKDSVPSGT